MDDYIDIPTNPINLDSNSQKLPQNSRNPVAPPVMPTEDSYFSSAPTCPRPFDLRNLGVILNNKRRATQHVAIRGAGTAWIDQDDSGTYDPTKERATPPATPPRRRKRPRITESGDDLPRPQPQKSRRAVGYRSLLTFSFTSQKALDYLRSLTPGPFDSQSTAPDDGLSESLFAPEEGDLFGPPLLRRKMRRSKRQRQTLARENALTIDQLTIGDPQRKGCKACFEVGDDDCSLIEHGDNYPCTACDDAGFDCELIIPPELKKSCERCKQKRISCSYRIGGGKGMGSCDACQEAEAKCTAAPLKSLPLSVSSRDSSLPTRSAPKRLYVACNQCRNNSKKCNLKKDQPGPCSNCRKNEEDCAFVLVPVPGSDTTSSVTPPPVQSKRSQKKAGKKQNRHEANKEQYPNSLHTPSHTDGRLESTLLAEAYYYGFARHKPSTLLNERERYQAQTTKKQEKIAAEAHRSPSSTAYAPEFIPPLGISGGIPHVRIKTAFSHPIKFNYIPDPMGTSPCSWCTSPFFGLFGHGDVEVEVVPFPAINGHGYEEMPGGHADKGKERSQMCVSCTFERVKIMGCEKHEFLSIEVDPRITMKGEMEKSIQALLVNDKEGGKLASNTKWCSICPSPAYFRCGAPQVEENLADEILPEGSGCGFLVCRDCKDLVTKIAKYSGSAKEVLDRAVRHAGTNLFTYEFGVRADASFLTSMGELMVRIQKSMGEKTIVGDANDGALSSDGEAGDEEIWTILEEVGKGKWKWNEKQKPVPAGRKASQGMSPGSFWQTQKQPSRAGMGARSKSLPQSSSQGSGAGYSQMGVGGRIDDYFEPEGRGKKIRNTGKADLGRSLGTGRVRTGPSLKGKGKGKAKSEVVIISDSEDDW